MLTDAMDLQNLGWSVSRTGEFERPGALSITVAVLPSGHDPDSLLRAEGAAALASRLDAARPLLSFVLDRLLAEEDLGTARGRSAAHARIALLLSKVTSADEATTLSREAARRLGVDATQLWIEAQRVQGARARSRQSVLESAPRSGSAPWRPPSLAERDLLALLLHVDEARAALLGVLEDEDLAHPGLRALLGALRRAPGAAPEALMADLPGEAEQGLLASLLVEDRSWSDALVSIEQWKKRYDIRRRKQRVRQVFQAIAEAQSIGDPARPALEQDLRRLQREAEAVRDLARERSSTGPQAPR
jgi:DNA primase